MTFCWSGAGTKEAGCAGGSASEPFKSSCRVKGQRKGRSSFEAYVERCKRRKREERKEERKREKLEERLFLADFDASLDALAEEEISRRLVEDFREQYSLRASEEFYPIVLRRPLRSNLFKDAALASLERFLAEHDKGVSNTGLPYKNIWTRNFRLEEEPPHHFWWKGKKYIESIKPYFEAYLEFTERHVLVFEHKETGVRKVLPYTTRFHWWYKRKVKEQLEGIYFPYGTLLTITTDLKRYSDPISAVKELKRRAREVLKFLRRELKYFHDRWEGRRVRPLFVRWRNVLKKVGKEERIKVLCDYGWVAGQVEEKREPFVSIFWTKGGVYIPPKELRYVCVLEFSFKEGNGAPHLHILLDRIFLNCLGTGIIRWLIMYPHCKEVKATPFWGMRARDYVMKYVKKQLVVKSGAFLDSACLYWITGACLFSTSKDLKKSLSKDEPTNRFLGVYPKVLRVYPIEEHLELLDDFEFLADVRAWDDWIWSSCIRKLKVG